MSIQKFKSNLIKKLGKGTTSKVAFAQAISSEYLKLVISFKDSKSGLFRIVTPVEALLLFTKILKVCKDNSTSTKEVDMLKQLGPIILGFWKGAKFISPIGFTEITDEGLWRDKLVKKNNNVTIFITELSINVEMHLKSMKGKFTDIIKNKTEDWTSTDNLK